MSTLCQCCNQPLKRSQYKKGKQYKSCPGCSKQNGKEHVYYEFPKQFGFTPLRVSRKDPLGAQSYCNDCRSGIKVKGEAYLCSDLQDKE